MSKKKQRHVFKSKFLLGCGIMYASLAGCSAPSSSEANADAAAEAEDVGRMAASEGSAVLPADGGTPVDSDTNDAPEIADLIGTFGVLDRGTMQEFIRISLEHGSFIVSERSPDGTWRESDDPMLDVSLNQFETMIGRPYSGEFQGLANNGIAVFRVPADFRVGGDVVSSGYFALGAFGPLILHKL